MPTVLRREGLEFFFYSNEGTEPPHVHVWSGNGTAKFWLDPIELSYSEDLKGAELRRAREIVEEQRDEFLRRWNEHIGS